MTMEINMSLYFGLYFSAAYALLMIVLRLKKLVNTTLKRFVFMGMNIVNVVLLAFIMETSKIEGDQDLWFLCLILIFVFAGLNLFFDRRKINKY